MSELTEKEFPDLMLRNLSAPNHITKSSGVGSPFSSSGNRLMTWRTAALGLLNSDNTGTGLKLSTIWNESHALPGHGFRARDLMSSMADQYVDLKREAASADMEDYFDAFSMNTMEGEVMRICKELHDKSAAEKESNAR